MKMESSNNLQKTISILDRHYRIFRETVDIAKETGHPVPVDTRAWSQILLSALTGIKGLERKKGTDLDDGSDVKAAITWEAIDTPRFNGVIKAGTKANTAGKIESLDSIPYLFLVLWDVALKRGYERCRIWCVRPKYDKLFRQMCKQWYEKRQKGIIISNNFQLHPPRELDSNIIRNTCGNLEYPLLFCAERIGDRYKVITYDPQIMKSGQCKEISNE